MGNQKVPQRQPARNTAVFALLSRSNCTVLSLEGVLQWVNGEEPGEEVSLARRRRGRHNSGR